LIALHRLDQGLCVMQLARVEHQQLGSTGRWAWGCPCPQNYARLAWF
jgi:hypothetical protein